MQRGGDEKREPSVGLVIYRPADYYTDRPITPQNRMDVKDEDIWSQVPPPRSSNSTRRIQMKFGEWLQTLRVIQKCWAVPPASHQSQNTGAISSRHPFFIRFGVFHSDFPYIFERQWHNRVISGAVYARARN